MKRKPLFFLYFCSLKAKLLFFLYHQYDFTFYSLIFENRFLFHIVGANKKIVSKGEYT